jgi:hypothetical protein
VRERGRALGLRQRAPALLAQVGKRFIVDLEAGNPTCQLGTAPCCTGTESSEPADCCR